MLAEEAPPITRPMNRQARLGAQAVLRKLMHMPAIEYSSTGRRPTRSLSAPTIGMNRNCSSPKVVPITPYHSACCSRPCTNSPTSAGSTGTIRPMPSMSMKTQIRTKFRLPGRAVRVALVLMGFLSR
jgi:hypothetical protein